MAIHQVKGHKITKKQAGKRMSIEHLDDKSFMSEVHHPAPMPSGNGPYVPGPAPVRSSHPDVASLLAHVKQTFGGAKGGQPVASTPPPDTDQDGV